MPIDEKVLRNARKLKHAAVVELLAVYYPVVHRISLALCGREDVGRGTTRFVMGRAVKVLPNWKDDMDPWRWFAHFTVIASRRAAKHQPDARSDVLVAQSANRSPDYVAFVRALRTLHAQQREAILLSVGEGLADRQMAVAMDCSVQAAINHREAGIGALRMVSPDADRLLADMRKAYVELTPHTELELPSIRRLIGRRLLPRRLMKLMIFLLILAGLIYIAWLYR